MRNRRATAIAAWLATVVLCSHAGAHPLAPSLLELREQGAGEWRVLWKTALLQPAGENVQPLLPPGCAASSEAEATRDAESVRVEWTMRCDGGAGARARIGIDGMREEGAGLLRIARTDGSTRSWLLGRDTATVPVELATADEPLARRALTLIGLLIVTPEALALLAALTLLIIGARPPWLALAAFAIGQAAALTAILLTSMPLPSFWVPTGSAAALLLIGARFIDDGSEGRRERWLAALVLGVLQAMQLVLALRRADLDLGSPLAALRLSAGLLSMEIAALAAIAVGAVAIGALIGDRAARLRPLPAYAVGTWAAFHLLESLAALR